MTERRCERNVQVIGNEKVDALYIRIVVVVGKL